MSNTAGVDLEELRVPSVGESITEVVIGQWRKNEGDSVGRDEELVELESEKATFEAPAPVAGTLTKIVKPAGSTAEVGEVIAYIDPSGSGVAAPPEPAASAPAEPTPAPVAPPAEQTTDAPPRVMPAAARELHERGLSAEQVTPSGPGNRLLKEDVMRHAPPAQPTMPPPPPVAPPRSAPVAPPNVSVSRDNAEREERKPMSPLRKTIASRLVSAQHNAALLTTFNEADLTEVKKLRAEHGEAFHKKHGVKLGFMAFFVKAVVEALKNCPELNASIEGDDLVYHNYFDIGIAIGTEKGLVVPILRDADRMGFAEVEHTIADYGTRARANKLGLDEMMGGTFTISNGGVYGSLLSTPIVNPPQSGVLGMHSIQERPIAVNGEVVIRPMMYLALTYDHRIVDGREAVTFLREIKEAIEEPARILIEI